MSEPDSTIFTPDETCWRVARADKLALIVDAADYFRALRKVFIAARRELLLIGWDFDFELEMLPGESDGDGKAPDGYPNKLGHFIEAVVQQSPDLNVYLLKWNGAVIVAPSAILPAMVMANFGSDRIHFALDGHHPFGACHHQKIVVADDWLAFCGGIDATAERWDTSDHLPHDDRRRSKDGTLSGPWHDATSAMTGPAAQALAELSRLRWFRATGEALKRPDISTPLEWPQMLEADGTDLDLAIARTEPPYDGAPLVNEIEALYLRSIEVARDTIYIESQYFAAERICEALEQRLAEPDGPEVVIITPYKAESELEDDAMNVLRSRIIKRLTDADTGDRFRIYYPVNRAEEKIYVHAKIFIVDDVLLRIGSSNISDRSLGFDTECDVAIERPRALITTFRTRLLSEHLDVPPDAFDWAVHRHGTLIAAIEDLNPVQGRGLRAIEPENESWRGRFLADTRLLDPRYLPHRPASTGQGVRPRHLMALAGITLLGYLGVKAWRARKDE